MFRTDSDTVAPPYDPFSDDRLWPDGPTQTDAPFSSFSAAIPGLSPEYRRQLRRQIHRERTPRGYVKPTHGTQEAYLSDVRQRATLTEHFARGTTYRGAWEDGGRFEVTIRTTPETRWLRALESAQEARDALARHQEPDDPCVPWGRAISTYQPDRRAQLIRWLNDATEELAERLAELPRGSALAVYDPAFAASQVGSVVSVAAAPEKPDRWVARAVSRDPARGHLCGMWRAEGHLVATDGYRMHVRPSVGADSEPGDRRPDWRQVIPSAMEHTARVDARALCAAIRSAVAAQVGARVPVVHLESRETLLTVSAQGTMIVRNTVPLASGNVRLVAINARYLLDALAGARGAVTLETADEFSPIAIRHDDGRIAVIMPTRADRACEPVAPPAPVAAVAPTVAPEEPPRVRRPRKARGAPAGAIGEAIPAMVPAPAPAVDLPEATLPGRPEWADTVTRESEPVRFLRMLTAELPAWPTPEPAENAQLRALDAGDDATFEGASEWLAWSPGSHPEVTRKSPAQIRPERRNGVDGFAVLSRGQRWWRPTRAEAVILRDRVRRGEVPPGREIRQVG